MAYLHSLSRSPNCDSARLRGTRNFRLIHSSLHSVLDRANGVPIARQNEEKPAIDPRPVPWHPVLSRQEKIGLLRVKEAVPSVENTFA